MKDFNSFLAVDYGGHMKTKIIFSINKVNKSMTIPELNTLNHVCEPERTQLLLILALSAQDPQIADYFLARNRSIFLYVEGPTAWL